MDNTLIIQNSHTTICNPTDQVKNFISKTLTYTDKSKQYQIKRMSKNSWAKRSPLYKELQANVKGQLFEVTDDKIVVSTGFLEMLLEHFPDLMSNMVDNRKLTGTTIVIPWVNRPYDLRDYQEEAVELMMNKTRGLINFATGLGKTLVATHFVKRYKKNALIVCPSESVAKQFHEQFEECFGRQKVGFYGGGKKQIKDLTVGIAASIVRHIDDFKKANFGVIIIDETHHTPATTFFEIAQGLSDAGKIFGLTATDYRSDGKDIMITAGCGSVIIRRDIKWGVEHGWLAEPYFFVTKVDTTSAKDFKDDKLKSYKAHVLNNEIMKAQIRDDAAKMMAAGKSVLILVDEVEHGKQLSNDLNIPFATGIDDKSQEYVDQLNKNKIKGLVGTDGKIGEGSDTKNVDVLVLANFVASRGPVIQAVGRGLRKQGNKTKCLILDYWPTGSTMLSRHCQNRISYYREITDKVKIIGD